MGAKRIRVFPESKTAKCNSNEAKIVNSRNPAPDLIICNGAVLTMDAAKPSAEAVAITGNRISAVGRSKDLLARRSRKTRVIDAQGNTIMPGFIEGHMHIFPGAAELTNLHLTGARGFEELRARVVAHVAKYPGHHLLVGNQVDYAILGADELLSRHHLDRILPDRPMLLFSSDHHTAWANSKALDMAGILHGKALPAGHEIVMGADHLATGELREVEACQPVLALAPELTRARLGITTAGEPDPYPSPDGFKVDLDIMRRGLKHCARHGITSFHNMDGNLYTLELLAALERDGELTARAYVPFHFKPFMPLAALERASTMKDHYTGPMLKSGAVKCFMDGVLDSYTAVMHGGYADRPDWKGDLLFSPKQFNAVAIEADRRGLQIAVHAIGDGAVHTVLNGYEAARKANGKRDSRHRIEHIEVILPGDIKRFKAMGVLASMQPPHPPGQQGWPLEPTLTRIGEKRWPYSYAWQTLKAAGAKLVFGTDWPVSDINPMRAVHSAVTRKPWRDDLPVQAQSLLDTLAAYTVAGAFSEFAEGEKGALKRGMLADVVVLSDNLEEITPEQLEHVTVKTTVCDGRVVFEG
jgi:predicted amidohydrolase YtcJ